MSLDALLSATNKGLRKKPSEFWPLVGEVWQDAENIRQRLSKWKLLWKMPIEGRRGCMSAEDILIFNSLHEQIEVWRGSSHKRYIDGLIVDAGSGKGCLVRPSFLLDIARPAGRKRYSKEK